MTPTLHEAGTIDRDWISKVRKTWKSHSSIPVIDDAGTAVSFLRDLANFVDRMAEDLLFTRGFWTSGLGESIPQRLKNKVIEELKATKAVLTEAQRRIAADELAMTPGTREHRIDGGHLLQWYTKQDPRSPMRAFNKSVRVMVKEAVDEATSIFSRKLLGALSRYMNQYNQTEIDFGTINLKYSIGRATVIMQDFPNMRDALSTLPRNEAEALKARFPMPEAYLKHLDAARKMLEAKDLGFLWYGNIFVQCKSCGGENPFGAQFGVGAHYIIGKDHVQIYSDPGKFITELIIHEFGHRYYYRFMDQVDRAKFDSYFAGAGATPETIAEVLDRYANDMDSDHVKILRGVGVYKRPEELQFLVRTYYRKMTPQDQEIVQGWLKGVPATSTYGQSISSEDFAEVFAAYVTNSRLSRDQLERFKAFLGRTRRTAEENDMKDLVTKLADRYIVAGEPKKNLISQTAYRQLFKRFTLRGMTFFDLYYSLYRYANGDAEAAPPEGWAEAFRGASRLLFKLLAREDSKAAFLDGAAELRPMLHRLNNGQQDANLLRRIALVYADMVRAVAQDRDVWMKPMNLPGQWKFFRLMSEKEEKMERLRRDDPDLFDSIQESRKQLQELDRRIEQSVLENGYKPSRKQIMGALVTIGTDPNTGERIVFDTDGDYLSVPEFISKRKKHLRARKHLTRVFMPEESLDSLRAYSEQEIEEFAVGEIEHVALTDDKAKKDNITRIYSVQMIDGEKVIVQGRFKGIPLNSIVNASGRMIEGTAYDYDQKTGRTTKIETKNPDGSKRIRVTREPYVTVTEDGRLFLKIPSKHHSTAARNAMAELSKEVPTIDYVPRSRKGEFYFDPKDFAAVREALGGMAMSQSAMEAIRTHFQELAKHELALSKENLKHYSLSRIGGFKEGRELFNQQKKALAWSESRGHSGVIALDTGVGKTSLAVSAMQKMSRDGILDEVPGGRVLYVCPTALTGNLPKECHKFLESPGNLLDRVDIMSYTKFTKEAKAPGFGNQYVAVIFDEAHELKNPKSQKSRAVMALNHPRKILLTASPMERSPLEVFVLISITNNLDLNTRDGRAQMKAFVKRFCVKVGGRIVGLKNDPIVQREFRQYIKQNMFFADKRDVEEIALPGLRKTVDALVMDDAVETEYRSITDEIQNVMRGLVDKYRDRNPNATDPAIDAARIRLRAEFQRLNDLALMPDLLVPGARNPKIDRSVDLINEGLGSGSRTILFTDSPKMAEHTGEQLSLRFPGQYHAVGLSGEIQVWLDGSVIKKYKKRQYKSPEGEVWKAKDWKVFILQHIVSPNPRMSTVTLTGTYAVGQNLQSFNKVIHLDRDSWNSETMKQRTARAWRTGQKDSVEEYTLDCVYSNPTDKSDETLDQIRKHMQQMESDLFDQVVIESQSESLGKEFFEMERSDASFRELNRRMMEMQMSPYLARVGEEEG